MNQHIWPIFGHDWAVDYLQKGITNRRVRHAYLIAGPPNVGKNTLAHAFAMTLNCTAPDMAARPCGVCRDCKKIMSANHSDIIYGENDPKTGVLKIEAIRAVTSRIAMKPYEGRYRIAIFQGFDRALPRAQDALLKTLEEPPPHAVLIVLTPSLEPILSTITSRSQIIHLRPVAPSIIRDVLMHHYGADEDSAELLSRISGGRPGWAIDALHQPEILHGREEALDQLDHIIRAGLSERFDIANALSRDKAALSPLLALWLSYWRDLLLYLEGRAERLCNVDRRAAIERTAYDVTPQSALTALRATQTLLQRLTYNLNLRLALEVLFLDYPVPRR